MMICVDGRKLMFHARDGLFLSGEIVTYNAPMPCLGQDHDFYRTLLMCLFFVHPKFPKLAERSCNVGLKSLCFKTFQNLRQASHVFLTECEECYIYICYNFHHNPKAILASGILTSPSSWALKVPDSQADTFTADQLTTS